MVAILSEQAEDILINTIKNNNKFLKVYSNDKVPVTKMSISEFNIISDVVTIKLDKDKWFTEVKNGRKYLNYPVQTFVFDEYRGLVYGYLTCIDDNTIFSGERYIDGPYIIEAKGNKINIKLTFNIGR